MVAASPRLDPVRLLDVVDVVVLVLEIDGTVTMANAAAVAAMVLEPDRILGSHIADLGCWDSGPRGASALREAVCTAALRGGARAELRLSGSPVEVIDARLRVVPDDASGKRMVVLSAVDVTERHRMQLELLESEARTRRIIDAVPAGIVEVGLDGRIRFANEDAQRLMSTKWGEATTTHVGDFALRTVWENGTPCPMEDYPSTRCIATGEPQPPVTIGVERPDGSRMWAVFTALPVRDPFTDALTGAVLTFVDITARVEAEHALERSEQRLAEAQRIGRLGHWEWDVGRGTLAWSDETYRIFGIEPGAFAPTYAAFLERVHPDDRDFVATAVDRALEAGAPYGIDHRIVRPGGDVAVVYETGAVTRGEDGAALRMLGTVQDITERKTTEAELRRSLEEKNVLLREVHHRVKNNLQLISSLLYLQSNSTSDAGLQTLLDESRRRIRAMALIHETLYQSSDVRGIPLREYVTRLVTAVLGSFTALEGRVDIQSDVADVALDIERAIPCGLIINELVTNSLKYAFEGRAHGNIRVSVREEGCTCTMEVSDDGAGLPRDLDLDAPSTLGLRLVKTLAEQLDAEVGVCREAGTAFTFRFRCRAEG